MDISFMQSCNLGVHSGSSEISGEGAVFQPVETVNKNMPCTSDTGGFICMNMPVPVQFVQQEVTVPEMEQAEVMQSMENIILEPVMEGKHLPQLLSNTGGQVLLLSEGDIILQSSNNIDGSESSHVYEVGNKFDYCQLFQSTTQNYVTLIRNGAIVEAVVEDIALENDNCRSTKEDTQVVTTDSEPGERSHSPSAPYLYVDTSGPDAIYLCRLCRKEFKSWKSYRIHFAEHLSSRYYKCEHCNESFNREVNLTLHSAIHYTENGLQCPSCKKFFTRLASLKSHIKLHEEDDTLICDICNEEFASEICLEYHMKEHKNFQPQKQSLECKICCRSFPDIVSYKVHKQQHQEIKTVLLDRCFKKRKNVKNRNRYKCAVCSKAFMKPSHLERHRKIHTGDKPFECAICGQKFTQKNTLSIHLFKHSGERRFRCKFCDASFTQKGNLATHVLRVHSLPKLEEKMYKCSDCACMFRKLSSLNIHRNKVHRREITAEVIPDEKKLDTRTLQVVVNAEDEDLRHFAVTVERKNGLQIYRCTICSKESTQLNFLIRHMKVHTECKPFKCSQCSKTFSRKVGFEAHMSLHKICRVLCCDQCTQVFSTSIGLQDHKMLCHGVNTECEQPTENEPVDNTDVIQEGDPECKNYQDKTTETREIPLNMCKYCSRTFEKAERLQRHLQNHINMPSCLAFEESDIEEEEKIENDEREEEEKMMEENLHEREKLDLEDNRSAKYGYRYSCNECGMIFTRNYDLNRHKDRHVRYKQYICAICRKPFVSLPWCKLHMKQKHDVLMSKEIEIYSKLTETGEKEIYPSEKINSSDIVNSVSADASRSAELSDLENQLMDNVAANTTVISQSLEIDSTSFSAVHLSESDTTTDIQLLSLEGGLEPIVPETVNSVFHDATQEGNDFAHRCPVCCNYFQSEEELNEHLQQQGGNCSRDMFPNSVFSHCCTICDMTFNSLKSLSEHNAIHGGNKAEYYCSYCSHAFSSENELQQHVTQHTIRKEFSCLQCGVMNISEEEMRDHISLVHTTAVSSTESTVLKQMPRDSNCEKAKYIPGQIGIAESSFNHRTGLVLERKKEQKNRKNHRCTYCTKEFGKWSDLKRHIRIHTGEKPFTCSFCGKNFSVQSTLTRHIITKHSKKKRIIICDICKGSYSSKSSLKVHMRLHTNELLYLCKYCGKGFATSARVKKHEIGCSKYFNYPSTTRVLDPVCDIQLEGSLELQNTQLYPSFLLENHAVRKSQLVKCEKSFKCDICSLRFNCKQSYLNHVKLYEWHCLYCDTHFQSPADLKIHLAESHAGEQDDIGESVKDNIENDEKGEKFYNFLGVKSLDLDSVINDLFPSQDK